MEGGFVKRQTVDGGPEVQDVALGGAIGLETVEEIFTQLDRTGFLMGMVAGASAWIGQGPRRC